MISEDAHAGRRPTRFSSIPETSSANDGAVRVRHRSRLSRRADRAHDRHGAHLGSTSPTCTTVLPARYGGRIRGALPLLGDRFLVLYGDTYLRIDYRRFAAHVEMSGLQGSMSVLTNRGRSHRRTPSCARWPRDPPTTSVSRPRSRVDRLRAAGVPCWRLRGRRPGRSFDVTSELAASASLPPLRRTTGSTRSERPRRSRRRAVVRGSRDRRHAGST